MFHVKRRPAHRHSALEIQATPPAPSGSDQFVADLPLRVWPQLPPPSLAPCEISSAVCATDSKPRRGRRRAHAASIDFLRDGACVDSIGFVRAVPRPGIFPVLAVAAAPMFHVKHRRPARREPSTLGPRQQPLHHLLPRRATVRLAANPALPRRVTARLAGPGRQGFTRNSHGRLAATNSPSVSSSPCTSSTREARVRHEVGRSSHA